MENRALSFFPPISRLGDDHGARLAWVVRLRWFALCAQALIILPALEYQLLEPHVLPVYIGVVGALALLNAVTWRALRRGMEVTRWQMLLQLCADIAALGALLIMTGGAWNPLVPLLFFHAGLGALLLEGRASVGFFWILILCLLTVQTLGHVPPGLEDARLAPHILFPAQLLVTGVFWFLASWLSRTLSSLQSQAQSLRLLHGRLDRLRAVGALAAGLSHELATPLNTAMLKLERLGRTQKLSEDADLRDAAEALERCEDVLRNMAGSQLRPEALSFEFVDVAELVHKLEAGLASDSGAKLRISRSGLGEASVVVPAIALTQALLNLIDNAREAQAHPEPIDVVVRRESDWVAIEVCDRGSGWPAVVKAHLGEPFITTKPDGVGLGLYYVDTLAQAVGGELELEDREDGGAIARLRLPARSAREALA